MSNEPTPARQAALIAFRANTQECKSPGCRTLVLHDDYCAKHRAPPAPTGMWAEAARIRDEQDNKQRKGNHER
jgi:hypothetical protein